MKQMDFWSGGGSEVNPAKIGGETVLLGDPKIKPEKPHTIIRFPGGSFEVARTKEGLYWVHIAVRAGIDEPSARIVRARINAVGRYADPANAVLNDEIATGEIEHIAFLVDPRPADEEGA